MAKGFGPRTPRGQGVRRPNHANGMAPPWWAAGQGSRRGAAAILFVPRCHQRKSTLYPLRCRIDLVAPTQERETKLRCAARRPRQPAMHGLAMRPAPDLRLAVFAWSAEHRLAR